MGNTPLLTVRCPDDLMTAITSQVASTDRTKTEIVVEMLRNSVPSVPILERNKLPESPAIYFVITPNNKLLYIGQSKNLRQRWQFHHRFQQFIEASPDTRVVWFEFDEDDHSTMPSVEGELITLLDAEYNGSEMPSDWKPNIKPITVYLPSEAEQQLLVYCSKYDITRKDKSGAIKPALGTAIVEILKVFFSGENTPHLLSSEIPLLPNDTATKSDLDKVLESVPGIVKEELSTVKDDLPSNVVSQDDLSKALGTIPSIVNEQLESAISQGEVAELIANQITSLKNELNETIDQKLKNIVSEFETGQDYDTPTITKINKKTLAPIIDDKEKLPTQIDKSSLEPIFDDDLDEEEDVDWNELKVGELRKVITIKGLGNKFREKLKKSPRESKKAEIVKFLSETSIFDLD